MDDLQAGGPMVIFDLLNVCSGCLPYDDGLGVGWRLEGGGGKPARKGLKVYVK